MGKRKRLTPVDLTLSAATPAAVPLSPARVPIAQVAGDAAAQSALSDLANEMTQARLQGRLAQSIPVKQIAENYLVRDRMVVDAAEMASLKASIAARGLQSPIEVVAQSDETYGLISGWRRLQAFRALLEETQNSDFASIPALIKPLDPLSNSYVAMVEENEIRADLSFFERAHLAAEAARLGVYATLQDAVQTLFANATPARRSKILAFTRLHAALGDSLKFPAAIPEKLGLALVKSLDKKPSFAKQVKKALSQTARETAAEERAILDAMLRPASVGSLVSRMDVVEGITLEMHKQHMVLRGLAVSSELQADLIEWLKTRKSDAAK